MPFQTHRVRVDSMYNYLPWPSNMRTADHVLSMRIQEGAAGYGIYVMLLELLRDSESRALVFNPRNLAFAINEPDEALVERVISQYGLFDVDDRNYFRSPWLESQMEEYDAKKAAAQEAGRRGAAKRYGKKLPEESAEVSDPIGTLTPPLLHPHSNITQYNSTNPINSTKSKLLSMSWGDMSGEDLFCLARNSAGLVDDITRQWAEGKQKELDAQRGANTHNLSAVLDCCDFFKVGTDIFAWLLRFTNYAQVDRPPLIKLMKVWNQARETNFKPKYPAEYIIVKLLEP